MVKRYGVVAVACVAAAAMGLTACGGRKPDGVATTGGTTAQERRPSTSLEDMTAQQISTAAGDELAAALSLHFKLDSTPKAGPSEHFDLDVDSAGNCAGKVSTDNGSAEVIKLGDAVWLKPDRQLWTQQSGAQAAEKFAGRYIHGTTSHPLLKGLAGSCNLKGLQDNASKPGPRDQEMVKGKPTVINGQKVLPIIDRRGQTTVYVAAEGKPYPVRLVLEGDEATTLTLTNWDKPVTTSTPSADQTIDVDDLAGAGEQPSHSGEPGFLT
ncbi:hypothetical protein [Streptomyces syringium]|uniref:hypothetical protein n=1 Tax=Streptomyces syringium TaxID=76729 RepID=UPI003AAAB623